MRRLFWRVQRPVVDTGRGLVARLRPPQPTSGRGPLDSPHAGHVLAALAAQPLAQPDRTSCGSSTLTVLRMLTDPAYAETVLGAPEPQRVFARAALGLRRRTNALLDCRGHLQLRWPAALGVRPAAMVRLLDGDPAWGATDRRHHNVVIDPAHPEPAWEALLAAVRAGHAVPFYVGDGHWMQHIVLVVRAGVDRVGVYDPAVGHEVIVTRQEFCTGTMVVAGWRRPWLLIL